MSLLIKSNMKKICVFDLDGTLVDSMPGFTSGMLSVPDEEGIPYTDELIGILTPLGYRGSAEYYVNSMGVKDTVDNIVSRIEKKLVREYSENIILKPFVMDYLKKLYSEGARLFVLTASPHLVTDVCLKRNGVFDMFEAVWSVDDYGLNKSGTELFFKVAERIGCDVSEINYYDDSPIAIFNAGKAGYHTYGIKDRQRAEEIDRLKEISDVFVSDFSEML